MTYLGNAAGALSLDQLRYHGLLPTHRPPARKGLAGSTKEYHMPELSVSRLHVTREADKLTKIIDVPLSELRKALGLGGDWIFVGAAENPDLVIEDREDDRINVVDGAVRFEYRLAE